LLSGQRSGQSVRGITVNVAELQSHFWLRGRETSNREGVPVVMPFNDVG
jgi:hypothetical protein